MHTHALCRPVRYVQAHSPDGIPHAVKLKVYLGLDLFQILNQPVVLCCCDCALRTKKKKSDSKKDFKRPL